MKQVISPAQRLQGTIKVPTDKSISHRSIMFSSIATGTSYVYDLLRADDVHSTMNAFRSMGISVEEDVQNGCIKVTGKGMYGLTEPTNVIDVGNSGTTIRLLMGILAAQPFHTVLVGDASIARRPMTRVVKPLREMGARIDGRKDGNHVPIAVRGQELKGITYTLPVASAQLKSSILLAGLYASGKTAVIENEATRNHTEFMLRAYGVNVVEDNNTITVAKTDQLQAAEIRVPGDISSAAFFIAAALLVPNSAILLKDVGVNPTRTGFLDAIHMMGASVELENLRKWGEEPVADLRVKYQPLQAAIIEGEMIPRLIDEVPILSVLATQAEGVTEIRNAEELRVKESDRIHAMVTELKKLGAEVEELPDGIRITGKSKLGGATVNSHMDHRIGMALMVAGLVANGDTTVEDADAVKISYPRFVDDLKSIFN